MSRAPLDFDVAAVNDVSRAFPNQKDSFDKSPKTPSEPPGQ